jgi:hypothetical protein
MLRMWNVDLLYRTNVLNWYSIAYHATVNLMSSHPSEVGVRAIVDGCGQVEGGWKSRTFCGCHKRMTLYAETCKLIHTCSQYWVSTGFSACTCLPRCSVLFFQQLTAAARAARLPAHWPYRWPVHVASADVSIHPRSPLVLSCVLISHPPLAGPSWLP